MWQVTNINGSLYFNGGKQIKHNINVGKIKFSETVNLIN